MSKFFLFINCVVMVVCHNIAGYAQTIIVRGKVHDAVNPLDAAVVLLGTKIQLTNYLGEFSFEICPGVYTLTVTHAGYKKTQEKINVENGVKAIDVTMMPDDLMGELVVLGSRSVIQRNNLNSAVPVDNISFKQLTQTGQANLVQMLNFIAPSFNASRQVANEPVTLRGLDPEHVLILLNGTRYHNTAWLHPGNSRGPLGRSSVGNDLNSIPFSAIEKIEILRDGSSAQYGSDAIAGVIDIRLKESTKKTSIQLHTGQYYKGDGNTLTIGINRGISLPTENRSGKVQKGFLSFSADAALQGRTDRGGLYDSTVYYDPPANASPAVKRDIFVKDSLKILERGFNRHTPGSQAGNSLINRFGVLVNGAYPVSSHTTLFWTSAFSNRVVNTRASFVFPKVSLNQINIGLFPDGFQPRVVTGNIDFSQIAGIRGMTNNNWHWDFSSSFGYNSVRNNGENTMNPSQSSLGKDAPTRFYSGKLAYDQLTNDINFSKSFYLVPGHKRMLNVGFGAEWRLEHYRTFEGEEASWKNYDLNGILSAGAQASIGINHDDRVNQNRNMAGGFIDLESEINEHLFLNVSGRYERYSDYGGNLAGKLSARYKVTDRLTVRGSLSNGFRAPSLQQCYYTSTATSMSGIVGVTTSSIRGVFPENSAVTRALDIPSLKAENALNASIGVTASLLHHINITVDAYQIQLKKRIILSGVIDRSNVPAINAVLSAYPDLKQIEQVQFFSNAINTRTEGIDIAINGKWVLNKSSLGIMIAANFTRTSIFGKILTSDKIPESTNSATLLSVDERAWLEGGQPSSKIILSVTYKIGKVECTINNTRFGSTSNATMYTGPNRVLWEFLSPKILTNVNINYSLKKWLTLSGGANNIFNIYPDRLSNRANTRNGILIYNQDTPYGYNGGYYFAGLSINL